MKKYTNKNSNERVCKKPNAFKMLHIYKENYYKLSKKLDTVNKQLKTYSKEYYHSNILHSEYSELIEKRNKLKRSLKKISDNFNNLKSKLIKIGCTIIAGVVLVSGSAGIGIHNYNKNLNENLSEAYETVTPYESFDTDYSNLDLEDIKNSPDKTTQLALDALKVKIAQSLGIEDPSTILISVKSTDVMADKFHNKNGHITKISIMVEDSQNNVLTNIGRYESFTSLSTGEESISENTISEEVLISILSITNSQRKDKSMDANRALGKVADLKINDIILPTGEQNLASNPTEPSIDKSEK